MDLAASLPEPIAADEQRQHDAAFYREVLRELTEMGTGVARRLHGSITAATTSDAEAAEQGVAFDRACRGVRKSILLARALDAPAPATRAVQLDGAGWVQGGRVQVRKVILRRVEDRIRETQGEGDTGEWLHNELLDRMDAPELEDDILNRPVDEIVKEIETDLGVARYAEEKEWLRRTPLDVAVLAARAAAQPGKIRSVATDAWCAAPEQVAAPSPDLLPSGRETPEAGRRRAAPGWDDG